MGKKEISRAVWDGGGGAWTGKGEEPRGSGSRRWGNQEKAEPGGLRSRFCLKSASRASLARGSVSSAVCSQWLGEKEAEGSYLSEPRHSPWPRTRRPELSWCCRLGLSGWPTVAPTVLLTITVTSCDPYNLLPPRCWCYPHFSDEKTEAINDLARSSN